MEFELRNQSYTGLSKRLQGWKHTSFQNSSWRMYNGDMWDSGRGYIGPIPAHEDPDHDRVMSLISRAFTSRNVVAEVVDRLIDSLLSKSPNWNVFNQNELLSRSIESAQKRLEAQQRAEIANKSIQELVSDDNAVFSSNKTSPGTEIEKNDNDITVVKKDEQSDDQQSIKVNRKEVEAEIILSNLWTKLNLRKVIAECFAQRLVTGRGTIRVYIPKKFSTSDGTIKSIDDLLKAMEGVRAEWVNSETAKVLDEEGEKVSVVRLEKKKGTNQTLKGIEVSFIDEDEKTRIVVYQPSNQTSKSKNDSLATLNADSMDASEVIEAIKKVADVSDAMFLDGNLILEEIQGKPFVTEQLLQNNRALNLDLTLGVNVLIEDGFTEMVTTNASIEYIETPDPANPGHVIRRPKALKRGSSTTTNLVGVQTYDEKGMKTYQTPGVTFRSPTSLESFNLGESLYYRQCLSEAKQLFVLISTDSTSSGESRIQARQDFLNKSLEYKPELDKIGGWLLTTLLHLVSIVSGKPEYFKEIGVFFDSRITAGELSSDEKNVVITMYEKHLISRERAMILLGSEDPIIELDAIRADEAEQMENQIRRLVATSRFSNLIQQDKEMNNGEATGSKPKERDNKNDKDKKVSS